MFFSLELSLTTEFLLIMEPFNFVTCFGDFARLTDTLRFRIGDFSL